MTAQASFLQFNPLWPFFGLSPQASDRDEKSPPSAEQVFHSWLEFLSDRLEKDVKFPQQLGRCRTPFDCTSVTLQFWQEAYRDYSIECRQLAESFWSIGQAATRETTRYVGQVK